MHPPVDYPLKTSKDDKADSPDLSYAALLDRYDSEQPITDHMIQLACQKMDEAQQFPFATNTVRQSDVSPTTASSRSPSVITSVSNGLLGRLKNIIR